MHTRSRRDILGKQRPHLQVVVRGVSLPHQHIDLVIRKALLLDHPRATRDRDRLAVHLRFYDRCGCVQCGKAEGARALKDYRAPHSPVEAAFGICPREDRALPCAT